MSASEQLARALGPRPGARVEVLGPCPGCGSWQVDIADDVPVAVRRVDFVAAEVSSADDLGDAVSKLASAVVVARSKMIEEALLEHAAECAPLRAYLAEIGQVDGRG